MLETITRQDFDERAKLEPVYWKPFRWTFHIEVIRVLQQSKLLPQLNTAVELGSGGMPIVKGADIFDIREHMGLKPKYKHDATVFPWPIKDKVYDLFIALQTWEHLENQQTHAFREAQRIANFAIISVPYKWERLAHTPKHRWIDDEIISFWTLNMKPMIQFTSSRQDEGPRTRRRAMLFDFRGLTGYDDGRPQMITHLK